MQCTTKQYKIKQYYVEKNAIDENPVYQRESAVWSPEKRKLFIDSIINNYDIPKIYFHDLRKEKTLKQFAIIDGKQRLKAISDFLSDYLHLDKDFKRSKHSKFLSAIPGIKFSQLDKSDRERFKSILLPIVFVENADEDDIEDLFFRLNNGEPLNAAEKRNARGGEMNTLIRLIASTRFFSDKLKFTNKRYGHYEISAKLLLLEKTEQDSRELFADLKKKFLDKLVKDNKSMTKAAKDGLQKRVLNNLAILNKVFSDNDPLLSKQATPPLYYVFIKSIVRDYGHSNLYSLLRNFLEAFHVKRLSNLELEEEKREPVLIEFGRLMQQGTNDITSIKERVSILKRYFLLEHPDVVVLDKRRQFSQEERYVVYVLSGKKCMHCRKPLADLKDMETDHKLQWKFGGKTRLKNGQALCINCNKKLAKRTK